MKSVIKKILSFFLAVAILFTTSSFTVDMHFCCNTLVDIAILGKADVCKDKVQKNISTSTKCELKEKDCCDNQTFVKQGDDTFKKSDSEVEIETPLFLNTFFYCYINLFEGLQENFIPFEDYRPPLLHRDIHTLYETFII